MSSSATYNLIFPPGCSGSTITPGCFPCPSSLNDAPTTGAQYYVVGGAGLQVNTVKLGSQQAQYNYTVVSSNVPLNGVQNGLVLYMSACQSPVQASVVILPTGADVATSLTSLYNLYSVDAVRINLNDPVSGLWQFLKTPAKSPLRPPSFKSISWSGEGTSSPFNSFCSYNKWSFSYNNVSNVSNAAIATVQANGTPFPTSFCQVLITPNTVTTQNERELFANKTRLSKRGRLADATYTQIQATVTMQGATFTNANAGTLNSTYLALNLATPVGSLPYTTAISLQSNVQIVLVWTYACNLSLNSIYLYSQAGAPCQTYNCSDQASSPPNEYQITQLSVPVSNNLFPSFNLGNNQTLSWSNIYSYRTTLLFVLEAINSTNTLPAQGSANVTSQILCAGANVLVYTGTNSNFANCPPYSGYSSGTSTTMLRAVLGGSPGPTGTGLIPAGANEPQVYIPNLVAICSSETDLYTALTSSTPPTGVPSFANWTTFIKQFMQTMPNYFTLDVTIVELPIAGKQQVYLILRGIPYVPPAQSTMQLPKSQTSSNMVPLPAPIPLSSNTWNSYGPAPIPTLVLQLDQSPFPANDMSQRNVAVNLANFSQSGSNLFVNSSIGVPGLEYSTTTYNISPPILKMSTPNNRYAFVSFAAPNFAQPGLSFVLYTVPLPQVTTGQAVPVVPCLRVAINQTTDKSNYFCAITDGNDAYITPSISFTTSQYSQAPSGSVSVVALFEIQDTVKCFVWVSPGSVSQKSIPATPPTHVLVFPFNPFSMCSYTDTLYMYSHTTSNAQFDFMGQSAYMASSSTLENYGTITSFPCPPNLGDPTQLFNLCTANTEPTSGFMLDSTLDPLALVGIYDHTTSAQADALRQGRDIRAVVRERGETWDELQRQAKEAQYRTTRPKELLQQTLGLDEQGAANLMQTTTCPNGAAWCAPAKSQNALFNYNYNSIATACPMISTLDQNVQNCLLRDQTCPGLNCNPDGNPSTPPPAPRGQCDNVNSCDLWLQTYPGMSRSCLTATQRAAAPAGAGPLSLGPFMPSFSPDPSACAFPNEMGASGCPSIGYSEQGLCQVATEGGMAQYTSTCYDSQCATYGTTCSTFCDSFSPSKCEAPDPAVFYKESNPCSNGLPADVYNTANCAPTNNSPTIAAVTYSGLFPFAYMPCAANLTPVATSSFPVKQQAASNYVGCPNTTSDEASWFQSIFGCVAKTPTAGSSMNQFGESVIPAPYPGDLTGVTVPIGSMCGTSTSGPATWSNQPANWPWNASCTADSSGNPAVLFTLASPVPASTVYAYACLDPSKVASGQYNALDPSTTAPVDVYLSYCNSGNMVNKSGDCSYTAAQFIVTTQQPFYQAVGPKGASTSSAMVVCGQVDPSVWSQAYGSSNGVQYPSIANMTTRGVPTERAPWALSNIFTSQASYQYMTTGTLGPAVPVYLDNATGASALPSGVNLVVSADVNLTSALPLTGTGQTPDSVYAMVNAANVEGGVWNQGGAIGAQQLGITPLVAMVASQ